MILGERIARRREALGMTQRILAEDLGILEEQVVQLETAREAKLPFLEKVANALGCSISYLKGEEEAPLLEDELKSAGKRVLILRARKDLSRRELAHAVGLPMVIVTNMEIADLVPQDYILKIAECLGCTADYLRLATDKPDGHANEGNSEIESGFNAEFMNLPEEQPETASEDIYGSDDTKNAETNDTPSTDETTAVPEEARTADETSEKADIKKTTEAADEETGNILSTIGKRITMLREKKGMAPDELADKIDVSSATVRRIEQGAGNPAIKLYARIAEALNVSVNYIVVGNNEIEYPEGLSLIGGETLGDIVKMLREAKGYNYSALAKAVGASGSTIKMIETTSATNVDLLRRIAGAVGCSFEFLMCFVTADEPNMPVNDNNEKKEKSNMATVKGIPAGKKNEKISAADAIETLGVWKETMRKMVFSDLENEIIDAFNNGEEWQKMAVLNTLHISIAE